MISELRRYRIKPGMIDSWLEFFREAARQHEPHGIRVEYAGVNRETNTFVWLRSFDDEADRARRKAAFYAADWWLERQTFAMDHVVDYDVTFLDAALLREGGEIVDVAPGRGERPGSRGDAPPDGWVRSSRAVYVRDPG